MIGTNFKRRYRRYLNRYRLPVFASRLLVIFSVFWRLFHKFYLFFIFKRADYWVSQGRKYCDFCKCWITDNRPSIDFHEKGRRHQENVKKKLRSISKHSTQVQRNTDKIDVTIRQMESAALESYKKDMETNADMSAAAMRQQLQGGSRITKLWNEQKTRDGKSFYVNIMTKETVWRPPPEGYSSLQEQREQANDEAYKQFKALEKLKKKEAIVTMHKIQQEEAESAARKAREEMKKYKVTDDIAPTTCGPLLEPGKTDPYGRWQVVRENVPVVDLQLPVIQQDFYYAPVEYEPEPIREFKEKTVESLNDGETGDVGFKKRKFNSAAKRNTRQRLDDD